MSKRLDSVLEELRNEFDIDIVPRRGNRVEYNISAKKEEL